MNTTEYTGYIAHMNNNKYWGWSESCSTTVIAAVIDSHSFTHSWCVYAIQSSCNLLAEATKL